MAFDFVPRPYTSPAVDGLHLTFLKAHDAGLDARDLIGALVGLVADMHNAAEGQDQLHARFEAIIDGYSVAYSTPGLGRPLRE